jgi:hypothetical protein
MLHAVPCTVESDRARQLSGPVSSVSSLLEMTVAFTSMEDIRCAQSDSCSCFRSCWLRRWRPAFADVQHLVPPGQFTATVTDRSPRRTPAARQSARRSLAQVRDVATSMHLDLARGGRDRDAHRRGSRSGGERRADGQRQLVGGASTVVISTTTIIIILLLVILLIIAIK